MKDHQQRVVDELANEEENLGRLDAFLADTPSGIALSPEEGGHAAPVRRHGPQSENSTPSDRSVLGIPGLRSGSWRVRSGGRSATDRVDDAAPTATTRRRNSG